MALNNLTTVTTSTVIVAGVKLTTTAADRLGLGFTAQAYPADNLSLNPASEQDRSRQEQSEPPMRKQTHPEGSEVVAPVPDGLPGCLPPGSRTVSCASPASASWPAISTDPSRTRFATVSVSRNSIRRDCQSPAWGCDKQSLLREVAPAATVGK
ncbi:MAG TPA: hypothetical protein VGE74_09815 [Gemmata sp.]